MSESPLKRFSNKVRCAEDPAGAFVQLLWRQPLWALPFALVFGTIFGRPSLETYWLSYKISLAYAYSIGLAIWTLEAFVLPRFGRPAYWGGTLPLWTEAALYACSALGGAGVAVLVTHFWIFPEYLTNPRSLVISAFFVVVFTALFTGISYAIVFYRTSVERARAVEAARAELARAELRALRAQINPHFLFNTLNSIASLISVNPAAAEDTTTRLAEIFRYALTTSSREQARLADEVDFLRDYLAIEHIRFGERLRVRESIDPDLEDAMVPSLLLQPLVENAVKYAVSSRPEGGTVAITARRDGDDLLIEVADDGPGIDRASANPGTGFGLNSVRERLRASGRPDAIAIESSPGSGTRIRIRLPLEGQTGARPAERRA